MKKSEYWCRNLVQPIIIAVLYIVFNAAENIPNDLDIVEIVRSIDIDYLLILARCYLDIVISCLVERR